MIFYGNWIDSIVYFVVVVILFILFIWFSTIIDNDTAALERQESYMEQINKGIGFLNMDKTPEQYKLEVSRLTKINQIMNWLVFVPIILLVLCNVAYKPSVTTQIVQAKVTNLSLLNTDNPDGRSFDIYTRNTSVWSRSDAEIYPRSSMIKYSDTAKSPQLQIKTKSTKRLLWSIFKSNRVITSKDYYLILPVNELK